MINISWVFFDVGSTLVDESRAYEHRMKDAVSGTDISFDQLYEKAMAFYRQNKKGDLEALAYFELPKTPWHSEDEFPYPQAKDLLARLHQTYKIGIIANQSFGTAKRLEAMGLLEYIDLVVSSAEEGVAKPDQRIFYIALEKASCCAENAVMIGDRLDNDILPAKRIGIKTIWVRQGFGGLSTPRRDEERPDYTVEDLEGIYSFL